MTWIKHNWAFLLAASLPVLPVLLAHIHKAPHLLGLLAAIIPLVIKQLGSSDITAAYHKGLKLGKSIKAAEEKVND